MLAIEKSMLDECWIFAGVIGTHGYGVFSLTGGSRPLAHRVMYENTVGPIPDGLEIDHLCKNRCCINPKHLEPVTPKENMQRRFGVGLCKRGHKLTPDNCYVGIKDRETGRIGRQCKRCRLDAYLLRSQQHVAR